LQKEKREKKEKKHKTKQYYTVYVRHYITHI